MKQNELIDNLSPQVSICMKPLHFHDVVEYPKLVSVNVMQMDKWKELQFGWKKAINKKYITEVTPWWKFQQDFQTTFVDDFVLYIKHQIIETFINFRNDESFRFCSREREQLDSSGNGSCSIKGIDKYLTHQNKITDFYMWWEPKLQYSHVTLQQEVSVLY